jgi:hypothetical protein
MLSSNGMQAMIEFFLNLIKLQSPNISPSIFMIDHNHAQVNVICTAFPECQHVFYCWWHLLCAIYTHFNMKEFPKLWTLIQFWVYVTDSNEFNLCWTQIKEDTKAPRSIAKYIAQEWLSHKDM